MSRVVTRIWSQVINTLSARRHCHGKATDVKLSPQNAAQVPGQIIVGRRTGCAGPAVAVASVDDGSLIVGNYGVPGPSVRSRTARAPTPATGDRSTACRGASAALRVRGGRDT